MKLRLMVWILAVALLVSVFPTFGVAAEEAGILVTIDGQTAAFEQPPVMENDRVLVPMRKIFEWLGAAVEWSEEDRRVTATRGNTEISLQIDVQTATIDGRTVTLDVPARLVGDYTMVPIRFVSEALSCQVNWVQETNTVVIATNAGDFTERKIDDRVTEIQKNVYRIYPTDDAYVQGGPTSKKNFGYMNTLCAKASGDADKNRRSYLKFDLTPLEGQNITNASFRLYATTLENRLAQELPICETTTDWNEREITWDNCPAVGEQFTTIAFAEAGYRMADITDYAMKAYRGANKLVSFVLIPDPTLERNIIFSANNSENPPMLIVATDGAQFVEKTVEAKNTDDADQIFDLQIKPKSYDEYHTMKIKKVDAIEGFTPSAQKPELSKYGGYTGKKAEATGFFRVEKIGDRWWIIDPEGNYFITMGVGNIMTNRSVGESKNAMASKYADDNLAWAKDVHSILKNNGFNTLGAWSHFGHQYNLTEQMDRMPEVWLTYFLRPYGQEKGMVVPAGGSTGFANNIMPVFDPEFVESCENIARTQLAPHKDDPYFLGYFTDNELPVDIDMLVSYLTIDENDDLYSYSREAAWKWYRERKGENATVYDANYEDKAAFRGYVYEKYYEVVTTAIRKYDPNHMVLGNRLLTPALFDEEILKAAGKHLDIISINCYGQEDYPVEMIRQVEEWSGRPMIISEFYAKSDVDGAVDSGAGWFTQNRTDAGLWYNNTALLLLESGSCVGWHYFPWVETSTGIVDNSHNERTEMTNLMKQVNYNAYSYIDFVEQRAAQK